MENIGSRIQALRLEKNLSLVDLAKASDVSKGLLHRIENVDDPNPELGTLRKIAKGLETTIAALIGHDVVKSARRLPEEVPQWLKNLQDQLEADGKKADPDFLEALYVLQNRKGQKSASTQDWLYLYKTLEMSFSRKK
jgi:transcriptional regulator with XRE-family HTH domain